MNNEKQTKASKSFFSKKSPKEAFSVLSNDRSIFQYYAFKENAILQVSFTTFNLVVLLRKGTCFSGEPID